MIWVWLRTALEFILKLIIPPPREPIIPQLDPNEVCPGCGHRNGRITSVAVSGQMYVRHDCNTCKANWYVEPVLKSNKVQAPAEKV